VGVRERSLETRDQKKSPRGDVIKKGKNVQAGAETQAKSVGARGIIKNRIAITQQARRGGGGKGIRGGKKKKVVPFLRGDDELPKSWLRGLMHRAKRRPANRCKSEECQAMEKRFGSGKEGGDTRGFLTHNAEGGKKNEQDFARETGRSGGRPDKVVPGSVHQGEKKSRIHKEKKNSEWEDRG